MRKIIALILLASILMVFAGCARTPQDTQGTTQDGQLSPLTIGTLPAIDSLPLFIAYTQGFFEDEGLTVNLERFFSPVDRDIAFQTGDNIDGKIFDLVQLAVYQEAGIDAVATISTSGMASLVGAPDIHSVEDLRGQRVLMTTNTSMDYILDRALSSVGMVMSDIITYEVPALPIRLEMLLHEQAEGAILPDPFSTMALEHGYNIVATTVELGINPFILAFRREVTETRLPELQALYRAINRAVEFLNTADREEFIDELIQTVGFPQHVRDTLIIPPFPRYVLPRIDVVEDILDFTRDRGLLTLDITPEDIIFDIGN